MAVDEMSAALPLVAEAASLLASWLRDDPGDEEEVWPKLKKALEEERRRLSARGAIPWLTRCWADSDWA